MLVVPASVSFGSGEGEMDRDLPTVAGSPLSNVPVMFAPL